MVFATCSNKAAALIRSAEDVLLGAAKSILECDDPLSHVSLLQPNSASMAQCSSSVISNSACCSTTSLLSCSWMHPSTVTPASNFRYCLYGLLFLSFFILERTSLYNMSKM